MNSTTDNSPETLWTDVHLATLAPGVPYGAVPDGAVLTRGAKIHWVGPADQAPPAVSGVERRVVECGGVWLTPGLIDCHTHLVYAGNRSGEFELRLQGADYKDIARAGGGILSTVRATRAAGADELYRASLPRLERLLEEGVTTVEIKSGYGLDLPTELKILEVARRLGRETAADVHTTFLGAHTVPPEFSSREAYVQHVIDDMLPAVIQRGLADAVDVFCETIAFSPEETARIFEASHAGGLRVKLHADQLSDSGAAALGAKYRALSVDHLEFLSEPSAQALAQSGTVAVLLPGAFYFLREKQKPPVDLLRRHGVPIAIATDCNPGTSPLQSLLLTMNMACVLFGLSPEEALIGATRNAARALGLAGQKGQLAPGMAADFALWDIVSPSELAYGLGANPCAGVVKNGVLLWSEQPVKLLN